MYKKIYFVICFCFLFVFPAICAGNTDGSQAYPEIYKDELVEREPDAEFFQQFYDDKDFDYESDFKPLSRKSYLMRILENFFSSGRNYFKAIPLIYRILTWTLALLFIFLFITKARFYRMFYKENTVNELNYSIDNSSEKITDFDSAIRTELETGQYRNAIRLLFLQVIDSMDRRAIIKFSEEKTNRDFLNEMKDIVLQKKFIKLVRIYDSVWYGNYSIDGKVFTSYADLYKDFRASIEHD